MTATGRLKVGKSLLSSEFQRVFGTFLRPEFSVFSEQCKKRFSLAVQKAGRFQTKGTCHDRQAGPLAARMVLGSLAGRTVRPWVFGGPHLFE